MYHQNDQILHTKLGLWNSQAWACSSGDQDFNSAINNTLTRINRKVWIWMISMSKKSGNVLPKLADITSMNYTNGRFGMKFGQILSICNQATEGFPFCRSNFDLLSLSLSLTVSTPEALLLQPMIIVTLSLQRWLPTLCQLFYLLKRGSNRGGERYIKLQQDALTKAQKGPTTGKYDYGGHSDSRFNHNKRVVTCKKNLLAILARCPL